MADKPNTLEMPELFNSQIDEVTLERLFEDIRLCAEVKGVAIKNSAQAYASPEKVSLTQALHGLKSGQVRGVQIQYVYQGEDWWDTVMAMGHAYRIVRISPPHPNQQMHIT